MAVTCTRAPTGMGWPSSLVARHRSPQTKTLPCGSRAILTTPIVPSMPSWPVTGFFGLDVLLVYLAFKLNYRAARAYELVELTPAALKLTQVTPSGRSKEFEFNPYWVRVRFTEHPDGSNNLKLASHGREFEFGRLLNDDERRDFARVLEGALAVARTTPGT